MTIEEIETELVWLKQIAQNLFSYQIYNKFFLIGVGGENFLFVLEDGNYKENEFSWSGKFKVVQDMFGALNYMSYISLGTSANILREIYLTKE